MRLIELTRIEQTQRYSIGVIRIDSVVKCFCLEPPNKGNQSDISCIPTGIYKVKKYKSKKFKRTCLAIYNVFEREYIAMHQGNKVSETRGCIMPGLRVNNGKVIDSNLALDIILNCCDDENTLIIREI